MLKKIFKATVLMTCALSFMSADEKPVGFTKLEYSTNPTIAEAEKTIVEQVKGMESGWNNKSGAEFTQSFADDSYFVYNNDGRFIYGRPDATTSLDRALNSIYKNSNITFTVEKIHFLRPDVAVVHIGLLSQVKEKPEIAVKGQMMWIMSKNNGKWEISTLFYEFNKRWVDLMREIREGTFKLESLK